MSLPGTVDPERRVSLDAPVMRGWDGVELAPYLSGVGDAPLYLTNDTSALARSELFGQSVPRSDVLVVKASTGLGLGVIADGRLVNEHRGVTGELGHTRVDDAGDQLCRCGATGCLETIAGGWALVARLTEQGIEARHVRDLVALALEGDPRARKLLRESGRYVGEVLSVAVNLLNPQTVVIGGDMGAAFDLYSAGVREAVYSRSTARATRELRFAPAAHGDSAGLVGCAAVVIEQRAQRGRRRRSPARPGLSAIPHVTPGYSLYRLPCRPVHTRTNTALHARIRRARTARPRCRWGRRRSPGGRPGPR